MDLTFDRLKSPLIALALGLMPFWVFGGTSSRTVVNGRVVSEQNINLLGLVLAGIGLVMAFRTLRQRRAEATRWAPRNVLAILALIVCAVQLGHSANVYDLKSLSPGPTTARP